jgi:gluconolactonase
MTGACEVIVERLDGERLKKPNDLAFDRVGNLLFTCPGILTGNQPVMSAV